MQWGFRWLHAEDPGPGPGSSGPHGGNVCCAGSAVEDQRHPLTVAPVGVEADPDALEGAVQDVPLVSLAVHEGLEQPAGAAAHADVLADDPPAEAPHLPRQRVRVVQAVLTRHVPAVARRAPRDDRLDVEPSHPPVHAGLVDHRQHLVTPAGLGRRGGRDPERAEHEREDQRGNEHGPGASSDPA